LPYLPEVAAGQAEARTSLLAWAFARACADPSQKRYTAATRLFEKALADFPEYRFFDANCHIGACAAARAAWGDGIGATVDPAERAQLRRVALSWLRAELDRMKKFATDKNENSRKRVVTRLKVWLYGRDFSGLRPGPARTGLSAEELKQWDDVW